MESWESRICFWRITRPAVLFLVALSLAGCVSPQARPTPTLPDLTLEPANSPAQRTDPDSTQRHEQFNRLTQRGDINLLFLGDSITQDWEGTGRPVWDQYYGHRQAANFGIGGDRVQHLLWRIENGNLDGIRPRLVVLLIGTNNLHDNTPTEIVDGINRVIEQIRRKLPEARILLLGLFPRADTQGKLAPVVSQVNAQLAQLNNRNHTVYLDLGQHFSPNGTVSEEIMPDGVHLSEKGYRIWAEAMEPLVDRFLGDGQNP